MRSLCELILKTCCLVLLALPARAQDAVHTLSQMPARSELVITIENASALLEIDHTLIRGFAELGWIQQSRPAFDSLAERLGATPLEAFNRLLGRRATLVFRTLKPTPDWAVVIQVDPATATALPGALDAKPLRISSGLHVFALERRNFEIAVTPTDPNSQTAWSVIAPATSAALFDSIVDTLTRKPDPKELLAQGSGTELFADPLPASIAVFWSPPRAADAQPQAVLAAANREAQSWHIRVRATPTKPWFEQNGFEQNGFEQNGFEQNGFEQNGSKQNGFDPTASHQQADAAHPSRSALPTLTNKPEEEELVAVWSQYRSGLPLLDAGLQTLLGQVLSEVAAVSEGPRGIVIQQHGEAKTVFFGTVDQSDADMLSKADQLLTEHAGTSAFTGHLPGAVRRSDASASVFLGSTSLNELMWWMSAAAPGKGAPQSNESSLTAAAEDASVSSRSSASSPAGSTASSPASSSTSKRPWFFLVGTNARETLSPEQAMQWAQDITVSESSPHEALATGRIRPSAFAKGFLPESLQSNLHDMLRKMSIIHWSVYRMNSGVLGADIQIQLVPASDSTNP